MGRRPCRIRVAGASFPLVFAVLAMLVCMCVALPAHQAFAKSAENSYWSTDEYADDIWSKHADTSWYTSDKSASSYTIANARQLAGLAVLVTMHDVSFDGKTIRLASDIDLGGHQWFPIGCNEDNLWMNSPFCGTFDGQGHTIKNLYIENAWHDQALFGNVVGATIENFTLTGSVTTGWMAGGVVAQMSRTRLDNIVNRADVKTLFKSGDGGFASTAGGIVGYVVDTYVTRNGATPSSLTNLKNYGSVEIAGITEQGGGVGGIAGSLVCADDDRAIVVSRCENHGTVHANASNYTDIWNKGAGGIIGSTATYGNYQISDCSNRGDVSSANLASTGGITGSISGVNSSVSYCYNAGSVDGESPEEVASTGGIVGRSVAAHTGNTQLDITSCYNVGEISGRGGNTSAILGAESGYGEDWDGNSGGTTVNNVNNYYAENSVTNSSSTGVLFQSGTVEAAQPVSMERINSDEVIESLNNTDEGKDHYAKGKTSPKLDLRSSADTGLDDSSAKGDGQADQTTIAEDNPAQQKETHMYAIQADESADAPMQLDFNVTLLILGVATVLLVALGLIWQLGDYRKQKARLRAVPTKQRG